MQEKQFEYGILSRSIYVALLWVIAPVIMMFPEYAIHYLLFLAFLAIGLRPLLERSGLHALYRSIENAIGGRWNRKYLEKRRAEVERKKRLQAFKSSRYRGEDKLPKNW